VGKERRLASTNGLASPQWYLKRGGKTDLATRMNGLDPILAQVLYARKIDTPELARAFLYPPEDAADPLSMADMAPAVERLLQALRTGEAIAVYGDYDADGVTATALLTLALRALGGEVTPYIPDRFDEAYGLNTPALKALRDRGITLAVTVDCGVRSVEEVAHARASGLDLIITDHHSVPEKLPPAVAVINPRREDSAYPFRELAGVGVAYRLAQALFEAASAAGIAQSPIDADAFLDLVAVGTVADIVPLLGENRVLAQRGLARIRAAARPGIQALAKVAGIAVSETDSIDIAFRLGPRLNAAGRLLTRDDNHGRGGAHLALDLLLTEEPAEAQALAERLDGVNTERQALLENQVARAQNLLGDAEGRPILFVHDPDFPEGIVGLIASRLSDAFYRPALVLRRGTRTSRGSARSVEGIHITQALDENADLLQRWGGHALAAGVTLKTANLQALEERLTAYCAAHLDGIGDGPKQHVDAIVRLDELTHDTPAALALLEPFGADNPEPALATRGLIVRSLRPVGRDGRHLRLYVSDGQRGISAIAFRLGHLAESLAVGDAVDLVYRPTLNVWQGEASLQLVVQAIRLASEPRADGTQNR
jgi:single-stranded-DNA-specific exonuclease